MELAYRYPSGFGVQASSMCGWLRHYGLNPAYKWDGGSSLILLSLPDLMCLRKMQAENPGRFGNAPEAEFLRREGSKPVQWLLWVRGYGRCGIGYPLSGTLHLLLKRRRSVPFGVSLDRMQEAPEEVRGASVETVAAAVEWLREQERKRVDAAQ